MAKLVQNDNNLIQTNKMIFQFVCLLCATQKLHKVKLWKNFWIEIKYLKETCVIIKVLQIKYELFFGEAAH